MKNLPLLQQILHRIIRITDEEKGFMFPYWHKIFVSYTDKNTGEDQRKVISQIDFEADVAENELVSNLEFMIREQEARKSQYLVIHSNMKMMDDVFNGLAIDLNFHNRVLNILDVPIGSGLFPTVEGCYKLNESEVDDDKLYCNCYDGEWIWTIGQHKKTGLIFAAHDNRFFYYKDNFNCLYYR